MKQRLLIIGFLSIALAACGGGGGGGNPPTPAPAPPAPPSPPPPTPTVTLTASPASVTAGSATTLTWSSTNATACTASGGWTGAKGTSGSEQSAALTANTTFTLTCGSAVANAEVSVAAVATFNVSGEILVPANVQTDSDTNDVLLDAAPNNNTAATAQHLQNPVLVGGFVNEPGAGPSGPLQTSGDPADVYRVSLLAGQTIQLTVANPDPDDNDLDLELYDANGVFVDESIGQSRVEALEVPDSAEYYVVVVAYSGASNYLLSIGQTGADAASALRLSREFVPGELLVKTQASAAGMSKSQVVMQSLGLEIVRSTPGSHSLVRLSAAKASAVSRARAAVRAKQEFRYASDAQRQKSVTLAALKELRKRPDVEWAEPNWILRAYGIPNDPLYPRQRWHYESMQLPAAWDITTGNASVIAAVIDTGVYPHAELGPRLVGGIDFVDGDTDASDPGQSTQGTYIFHGTHVAGTIGAAGNDGQGVTGVAWDVSIMPIRVLGENGSGTFDDIINGIRYAAGLSNSSGRVPAQRAQVMNLSLGGLGTCPAPMQDAIAAARAQGTVVVAAAGNSNTSTPSTPASCDGAISVSAIDALRQRAPYSNYGDTVDVAAPGGNVGADRDGDGYPDGVYSTHASRSGTNYGSTHTHLQGTSMASPHVAGVVALMMSVKPNLTPAEVDTLLANGSLTDDIGDAGRDSLGVGAINALKAVLAASTNPGPQPARLDVVPSTLNFGNVGTSHDVVVSNAGSGTISVTGTATSVPWLTIAPVNPDANGLGTYRIQLDRTGLAPGVYRGVVEFANSGAPARVDVLMQVSTTAIEADVGQHYLLLIDPATGDAAYQIEVLVRGDTVAFSFPEVAQGQYELSIGTDSNNDGFICDDGEACGQYPVYGEPRIIEVSAPVANLAITTTYRTDVAPGANAVGGAVSTKTGKRRLH